MSKSSFAKLCVVPLLLSLASACVLVAAGAGAAGVFWVKGALEADLPGTPIQVAQAVEDGLANLKLPVLTSEANALDGEITSRTAGDDQIKITLESEGDHTEVTIRIGTFGDESMSRRILEEIEKEL